jgi:hypothetical protein
MPAAVGRRRQKIMHAPSREAPTSRHTHRLGCQPLRHQADVRYLDRAASNQTNVLRWPLQSESCHRPPDALGHVWTAPGCQGIDHVAALVGAAMCSAYQCGSQAAGHNALRGSGPGQKLAFDDALAQVGCPDHRIDRFCITCCPPFPTVPSRHCRRDLFQVRLAYRAKATGSL